MQLEYQFDIAKVCEQTVAVPVWDNKPVFRGVITLNDTAKYIFENLQDDITEEDLIRRVYDHFSCSEEDARANVRYIVENLREAKLLKE